MAKAPPTRLIGGLTFAEISEHVSARSILVLPLGAFEQHGPHLPLDTDMIIAEAVATRLVARHAAEFDTFQLPGIAVGLSREHEWAAGTLSFSISAFTAMLRDLGRSIARALPSRNLVIVNGHGGNRGILQNLVYELHGDFGLNVCVIHPLSLSKVKADGPDIHAGMDETSLMLALAPDRVRLDRAGTGSPLPDEAAVRAMILDPGVTWPWSSGDSRLAVSGVTGPAAKASAAFGERIMESILGEARPVLQQLAAASAGGR
ncbi:MAG TPA: creatininase family protein [Pseudorhodoplanes sp.]|jgi:creatinine amidohydrolase/Fe(II)-dependent formamide hydrolase-like protein|nr:creatininase family protein [Pseudorhodoplanes sp.]